MDRGLRVEKGQKESRHLGSGQTGAEVLQVSVCDHGMGELGLFQSHEKETNHRISMGCQEMEKDGLCEDICRI